LGICPAKFLSNGFKKGGKTIEDGAAHIESNEKAGEYDPPSIEEFLKHSV